MNASETDARTRVTVRPARMLNVLAGRSVRTVAELSGVPVATVGALLAYARGTRRSKAWNGSTSLTTARLIAEALGCPVGAVFSHPNGDPLEGVR